MNKWMAVGALALVLVAFVGWELSQTSWLLTSEEEPNVQASALAEDHLATESRDQRKTGDQPPRRSVLKQETDPRASTVCGRIVAAESGTPLAGAKVTLGDTRRTKDGKRVAGAWRDPEPVVSGPDGSFRIAVVRPESINLHLQVTAPGRVPLSTRCYMNLKPGAVMDHGDVPMPLGASVVLQVVDDQEQPVDDYRVGLQAVRPNPCRGRYGLIVPADRPAQGRTDPLGRRPPFLLGPGRWMVMGDFKDWRRFAGPKDFLVRAGDPPRVVTLRLRAPDPDTTATGRVVDASGAPLVGLELGANLPTSGIRVTRTDRNGGFVLSGLPPGELPVVLMGRKRQLVVDGDPRVRRGTENNVVVVRRARKVAVTLVVKDASGAPVERFAHRAVLLSVRESTNVAWVADAPRLGPQQEHPGGTATLELYPGTYMVILRPAEPRLAWALGQRIQVLENRGKTIPVVVPRWRHWQVRVLNQRRQPLKGTRVEVVRGLGGGPLNESLPVETMFNSEGWGWHPTVVTATATTDEQGIADLRTAPELGHAGLQLRGTMHQPKLVEGLSIPPQGRPLEILVEAAAVVRGRVVPRQVARDWGDRLEAARLLESETAARVRSDYPAVFLVDPSNPGRTFPSTRIGDDGSFRLEPVPTGTWEVMLKLSMTTGNSRYIKRIGPLARIADLRAGEEREVTVDASHLVKRTLRGLVQLDGAPAAAERLFLRNDRCMLHAAIHSNGTFKLRAPPGDYAAYLDLGGLSPRRRIYDTGVVRVGAQMEQVLNLSFEHRRLRLRLLNGPDDTPVADAVLWLQPAPAAHALLHSAVAVYRGTTNADGWVTFDPAPTFPVNVHLLKAPPRAGIELTENGRYGRYRSLGIVQPPKGVSEHQQVIRVKAR